MEFDRDSARYAAYFCEENIWHLADDLAKRNSLSANSFVLFLFNEYDYYIAVKNQRAFETGTIGCWDYHVVLLDADNGRVFDLDTRLDCPASIEEYFAATFPDQSRLLFEYKTTVRSVPIAEYINRFSSDREHMIDDEGLPLKEFPNWSAIIAENPIWLSQYLSVLPVEGSESLTTDLASFVASIPREN